MPTARKKTTPTRRRRRRTGLSAAFTPTKAKKAIGATVKGAIGGAAAGMVEKQVGELIPGVEGGTALIGAVVTHMLGQPEIAAGMAGVAGSKLAGRFGLADNYAEQVRQTVEAELYPEQYLLDTPLAQGESVVNVPLSDAYSPFGPIYNAR